MSLAHLYTDLAEFGSAIAEAGIPEVDALEEAQLDGFESGYKAGWDDAVVAKDKEGAQISSEFAQNLQDLSFTYHEAYAKVTAGLKPVLTECVTSLFPLAARHALRMQITDQVNELIRGGAQETVELAMAPSQQSVVEEILKDLPGFPFVLAVDRELASEQVYLRVNNQEREINLSTILGEMEAAFEAFFHTNQEERRHG